MIRSAVLLPAALALASCGGDESAPANSSLSINKREPEPAVALAAADLGRVCRAAIAATNGHSPEIISVVSNDGQIARVRYVRPSDGKAWVNECRAEGGRIIWRGVDLFGAGTGSGRWRDTVDDETVLFTMEGDRITINTRYPDGSGSEEAFTIAR